MRKQIQIIILIASCIGVFCLQAYSQTAAGVAPLALPACLLKNSFSNFGWHYSRVIQFNVNGSYIVLSDSFSGPSGPGTVAPHAGRYTYRIDPSDVSHATISYDEASGLPSEELHFSGNHSGTNTGFYSLGLGCPFVLYPAQVTNGGTNVSNRCTLSAGGTAITGFVVQSDGPRWVLVRAVGASLSSFGVTDGVVAPIFTINDSQGVVATSSVWSADSNLSTGYQQLFSTVGAFPLQSGSDDCVVCLPLNPGNYTVVYQAASAGTILCEVYLLPF
jgi:hypothetical protein